MFAKEIVKGALSSIGFELRRIRKPEVDMKRPPIDLSIVFSVLRASKQSGLSVVQVGANDGVTNDPVFRSIIKYASVALLIEPQEELIPSLRTSYSEYSGNLIIENKAVSDKHGHMDMYTLSREAAISYSNKTGLNPTGIASFQKSHLLKALVRHNVCNDMAEDMCIRCRVVECEPLSSILMRHSLEDIDVLQIDAEGSDWIILKTLGRMRPPVINIEWAHLNDQNRMECTEWMESNGYTHYLNRMDCLMIRENSCRHAVLSSTTTSI